MNLKQLAQNVLNPMNFNHGFNATARHASQELAKYYFTLEGIDFKGWEVREIPVAQITESYLVAIVLIVCNTELGLEVSLNLTPDGTLFDASLYDYNTGDMDCFPSIKDALGCLTPYQESCSSETIKKPNIKMEVPKRTYGELIDFQTRWIPFADGNGREGTNELIVLTKSVEGLFTAYRMLINNYMYTHLDEDLLKHVASFGFQVSNSFMLATFDLDYYCKGDMRF